MKYAVVEVSGKQYKVWEGQVLEVEKLAVPESKTLSFDKVLLYVSNGKVLVGAPYVDKVTVRAKVIGDKKSKKLRVLKFRAKSRYRRMFGQRSVLTKLQIESIEELGKKEPKVVRSIKKDKPNPKSRKPLSR